MSRYFIGLPMPPDIRQSLSMLQYGLEGVRWEEESKFHITLRFIGSMSPSVYRCVDKAVECLALSSFPVELRGIGYFPLRGLPEVLWAGIKSNQVLLSMQRAIEQAVTSSVGIKPEKRKFHPHVTIGRLKNRVNPHDVELFTAANALFTTSPFSVDHICLYSSQITSAGSFYSVENQYALSLY